MAAKKDFSQHALSIVEQIAGDGPLIDTPEKEGTQNATLSVPKKNPAAVALGRLGGLKGGRKRADEMSAERRAEIARKAAAARWSKKL